MLTFRELCEGGWLLYINFTFDFKASDNETVVDDGPVVMPLEGMLNPLNVAQRISFGVLNLIIVVAAILANLAAFWTIHKKKYQVLYKCCLVSQGLSDVIFAVFVGVDAVDRFAYDVTIWKFGSFLCGWIPYITTLCALVSSMTVTCVAFDRYQGIVLLRGKWDPNLTVSLLTMTTIWIAAGAISVPTFLNYNQRELCILDYEAWTCTYDYVCAARNKVKNNNYFVTVFIVIFLPLLAAFLGLYALIANSIYIKKNMFKRYENSTSTDETIVENSSHRHKRKADEDENNRVTQQQTNEAKYTEKKIRTFKIILVIMATFLICRLPQWVFIVASSYPDVDLSGNTWSVFKYLFSAVSLANTAINPFIYSFLNEMINLTDSLSIGFRKWLRGKFSKRFSKVYNVGG